MWVKTGSHSHINDCVAGAGKQQRLVLAQKQAQHAPLVPFHRRDPLEGLDRPDQNLARLAPRVDVIGRHGQRQDGARVVDPVQKRRWRVPPLPASRIHNVARVICGVEIGQSAFAGRDMRLNGAHSPRNRGRGVPARLPSSIPCPPPGAESPPLMLSPQHDSRLGTRVQVECLLNGARLVVQLRSFFLQDGDTGEGREG